MSETVGQVIKRLINAKNYLEERQTVSDEFMSFVQENLPSDYGYLEEKEAAYQMLKEFFSE